jgi:hypothetical protein
MADEKVFADGFSFKRSEKAPEFVIGRLSMKVDEAVAFIKTHQKSGWINLNVKQARSGNYYIELDTFEPTGKKPTTPASTPSATAPKQKPVEDEDAELPF